jgi:hypothetical protein
MDRWKTTFSLDRWKITQPHSVWTDGKPHQTRLNIRNKVYVEKLRKLNPVRPHARKCFRRIETSINQVHAKFLNWKLLARIIE